MWKTKRYLLSVDGGIEPQLHGPYQTEKSRDAAARRIHAGQDDATDALFWLDVGAWGKPIVGTFSGRFWEHEDKS
jgi:hypothetical protein